nr:uncharacterized protein LOC128684640 [Cherax quadricarinatus]
MHNQGKAAVLLLAVVTMIRTVERSQATTTTSPETAEASETASATEAAKVAETITSATIPSVPEASAVRATVAPQDDTESEDIAYRHVDNYQHNNITATTKAKNIKKENRQSDGVSKGLSITGLTTGTQIALPSFDPLSALGNQLAFPSFDTFSVFGNAQSAVQAVDSISVVETQIDPANLTSFFIGNNLTVTINYDELIAEFFAFVPFFIAAVAAAGILGVLGVIAVAAKGK